MEITVDFKDNNLKCNSFIVKYQKVDSMRNGRLTNIERDGSFHVQWSGGHAATASDFPYSYIWTYGSDCDSGNEDALTEVIQSKLTTPTTNQCTLQLQ